MSRGMPSLTALLGLLAVAGYQNRDKLAEMFGNATHGGAGGQGGGLGGQTGGSGGLGGMLGGQTGGAGGLGGMLGGLFGGQGGGAGGLGGLLGGLGGAGAGAGAGGFLNGGLNELTDTFRRNGQGATVDSWVNHGTNQPIAPHQLEQALDPDTIAELTEKTGLSREELLSRLSRELPEAIDRYTPDGRLPSAM